VAVGVALSIGLSLSRSDLGEVASRLATLFRGVKRSRQAAGGT
jgi:hypothetical protein